MRHNQTEPDYISPEDAWMHFPPKPDKHAPRCLIKARDHAWTVYCAQHREPSLRYNTLLYRYCRRYKFCNHDIWATYYETKVTVIVRRRITRGF